MSHIFISYSRKDIDFAQKIVDALAANNLDTWIDWKSIPKGEDWEHEIYRGIEEADAFLFLISPDSVISQMCNKEIAHAIKNGKRIFPIVIRDTDPKSIHPEISKRNWIFCRDAQDDISKAIEETRKTIHTDYEWLKYHTKLQVKTLEGARSKDNSRLLRGRELREAEQQLIIVGSQRDPLPTDLQRLYVSKSRETEKNRRRVAIGIGSGVTVTICLLVMIAAILRNAAAENANARATADAERSIAATQRAIAEAEAQMQTKIARAGQLVDQATFLRDRDPIVSLLISVETYNLVNDFRTRSALWESAQAYPQLRYFISDMRSSVGFVQSEGKSFNRNQFCRAG